MHKARPFFNDLVSFMISGPVMIQALEGEGAIAKNRELMGATDPKAEKGTIRADFADSIDANAVHGPTPRRRLPWKWRSSSRHERHPPLSGNPPRNGIGSMSAVNLLDLDLDGLAAHCAALGETLPRGPAVPLDPPERRGRLRAHDRSGQVVYARQAGRALRGARCPWSANTRHRPTAP